MLNDKDNSEGLLGKTSSASPALNNNNNNSIDEVFPKPNDSKVSKKREKR